MSEDEFDEGRFGEDPPASFEQAPFEQEEALWADAPAAPAPAAAGQQASEPPPDAPLALYRRYRPDTFAEVIGQDHVTAPLQRALANNRVNHAYLFSGPRGCGKTTSARILARALNCEKGPAPEPCGVCRSCRDLARGGPGSIDVIEIDAASHGGVDDARDLRERAFFAPVQSRYKIYIVDEAHMVTTAGFNALLKLVEEPPPHVKFIFATTEPDKVIGTIRSRTHHYPFRLVPPKTLSAYLARLCEAEGIAVDSTVLPLVVRAGAGSVRDSLSVLDQLLGGAEDSGVSYAQATALLGYTPDSLLDEIVDAFAAGDGGAVFAGVDKIIEVGQDPRRFAEDLLRRLRDLLVVAQVPDAVASGLIDVAGDQAERLRSQAAALGPGELTRGAEVIARGLTDMRGTTAPRLHLELMCSRILLPGADVDDRGLHARLDRLERRIGMDAGRRSEPQTAAPSGAENARPAGAPEPGSVETPPTEDAGRVNEASPPPAEAPAPRAAEPPAETPAPPAAKTPEPPPAEETPPAQPGALNTAEVRRLWPDVLEEVKRLHRFTWILVSQNAQVAEVLDGTLTLAMPNAGARESFGRGRGEDVLREALVAALGVDLRITTMVDSSAAPAKGGASRPASRPAPPERPAPSADQAPPPRQPSARESSAPPGGGWQGPPPQGEPPPPDDDPWRAAPPTSDRSAAARERIRPTRAGGVASADQPEEEPEPGESDPVEDAGASHSELLSKHLGAELIAEEPVER